VPEQSESMRRYEAAKKAAASEAARRDCMADGCRETPAPHMVFCARHYRLLTPEMHKRLYRDGETGDLATFYLAISDAKQHLRQAEADAAPPERVFIGGNTYPVREQLKELGATWDADKKGWWVPRAMKLRAEVLVGNADASLSMDMEGRS
jgi:hypothetical protein